MLNWIISRLNGRRIGEVRYVKTSPFIVGNLTHFLPRDCWTPTETDSLKYCANKLRWNGRDWEFVERLELTRSQWRELLETTTQ